MIVPDFTKGFRNGALFGFAVALAMALFLTVINNVRLEMKIAQKNVLIEKLTDCQLEGRRRW